MKGGTGIVAIGIVVIGLGLGLGCRSGVPDDPNGPIDTSCVATEDGALCTFISRGRTGRHCVKALLGGGAGEGNEVLISDDVCATGLKPRGVQSVAATFDKRPRDICGEKIRACTVRAVAPEAAEAVAASWRDELGAKPK
jgi:hypothetical protein